MNGKKGLGCRVAAVMFTLLVPLPMAGVIPWAITRWRFQPPLLGVAASRPLGAAMIAVGAVLLLSAIVWFAHERVKPYPPIERLITTGPYAYLRNPMYSGVVLVMIGQGLLFGSRAVFIYGFCWLIAFYVFELTIDDPFIRRRVGKRYDDYQKSVPGWIPRRPRRQPPQTEPPQGIPQT
jgi:protein-S-isoprenylcysteine O-methyltransferase Ste14